MNVLVTGSTGFLGSHLCRALVDCGHTVRAFHRATSNQKMLEDLPVEHVVGDLTRPESLAAAMQDVEVVFHAAALLSGDPHGGRMYAVTVEGTRNVLEAAAQAQVKRLVHTSSVAALGVPELGLKYTLPLDEQHTWNFAPERWPYGYSKYLAELEVQKAVARGLDAVIVNPTLVFGPGDIYRQTSSIIVKAARRRIPFSIYGGANTVHIQDVIAGHLAALERGKTGRRYILGGENLSHIRLLELIYALTGGNAPTIQLPAGLGRSLIGPLRLVSSFVDLPVAADLLHLAGYEFYYDTTRAQVELGLQPPQPAAQAIADAYAWFRQVGAIP